MTEALFCCHSPFFFISMHFFPRYHNRQGTLSHLLSVPEIRTEVLTLPLREVGRTVSHSTQRFKRNLHQPCRAVSSFPLHRCSVGYLWHPRGAIQSLIFFKDKALRPCDIITLQRPCHFCAATFSFLNSWLKERLPVVYLQYTGGRTFLSLVDRSRLAPYLLFFMCSLIYKTFFFIFYLDAWTSSRMFFFLPSVTYPHPKKL